jgi:hypothetical protein
MDKVNPMASNESFQKEDLPHGVGDDCQAEQRTYPNGVFTGVQNGLVERQQVRFHSRISKSLGKRPVSEERHDGAIPVCIEIADEVQQRDLAPAK